MEEEFDPEVFMPLSAFAYEILTSLSQGERHGYAILLDIAARTEGKLRVTTPTLYNSLKRLMLDKLIVEIGPPPDETTIDERRRYYRITPKGEQVLDAETDRLDKTVRVNRKFRPQQGLALGLESM